MKQATGNVCNTYRRNVSIRLVSGGHSFSQVPAGALATAERPVGVEILSVKTTLVPAEYFVAGHEADYLALAGLACATDETAVATSPENDAIAVMALARKACDALAAAFGSDIEYLSPLAAQCPVECTDAIWAHSCAGVLYIKVYGGGALRFAETAYAADEQETAYYLARVADAFPDIRRAILTGEAAAARKYIGANIGNILCE